MPIASEMSHVVEAWSRMMLWYSESATRATAPPPTPLKSATICGIAVILTLRAPTTPIAEPMIAAMAISQ